MILLEKGFVGFQRQILSLYEIGMLFIQPAVCIIDTIALSSVDHKEHVWSCIGIIYLSGKRFEYRFRCYFVRECRKHMLLGCRRCIRYTSEYRDVDNKQNRRKTKPHYATSYVYSAISRDDGKCPAYKDTIYAIMIKWKIIMSYVI